MKTGQELELTHSIEETEGRMAAITASVVIGAQCFRVEGKGGCTSNHSLGIPIWAASQALKTT